MRTLSFLIYFLLLSVVSEPVSARVCFLPGVLWDTDECPANTINFCTSTRQARCNANDNETSCERDGVTYYNCTCPSDNIRSDIGTNPDASTTYYCKKAMENCGCRREYAYCTNSFTIESCTKYNNSVAGDYCIDPQNDNAVKYRECTCSETDYPYTCDGTMNQLDGVETDPSLYCEDSLGKKHYKKCQCSAARGWSSEECSGDCPRQSHAIGQDGQTCFSCGPEICEGEDSGKFNLNTYWTAASTAGMTVACTALGYKTSIPQVCGDGNPSVVCSFDSSYRYCPVLTCAIGDVYYSDGTCSSVDDYDSTKKAVGVVYMLTDSDGNIITDRSVSNHGRVINLKNLTVGSSVEPYFIAADPYAYTSSGHQIAWGLYGSSEVGIEVAGLTLYGSSTNLVTAFKASISNEGYSQLYDGKGNTAKILATDLTECKAMVAESSWKTSCYPTAAMATWLFYPPNVSRLDSRVGQHRWYLPALGELAQLYGINVSKITADEGTTGATGSVVNVVNNTLTALASKSLESKALTNNPYKTSTAFDVQNHKAYTVSMQNGQRARSKRNAQQYVRASLEF